MEISEDDVERGSLDTLFIGGKGSRLINSELVGGTMSVGGDGPVLTDKMFIGGAEFLLTTSLVSLMTHGSAPRVDQPLSISLGKFEGIGVARPDISKEIAANIGYNCDIFWSRSSQLLII